MSGDPAGELHVRPLGVAPAPGPRPRGGGEPALDNEGAQGAEQLGGLQAGGVLGAVAPGACK